MWMRKFFYTWINFQLSHIYNGSVGSELGIVDDWLENRCQSDFLLMLSFMVSSVSLFLVILHLSMNNFCVYVFCK